MFSKGLELVAAVYALLPLVAFHINIYGRMTVASGVNSCVDLHYRSRYRRVYGSRHEASGLCYESSHLYLVSSADNGLSRSADVLSQREYGLLGQRGDDGGLVCRNLVLFGMNASHAECSQSHASASFLSVVVAAVASGFGARTGKFTFTSAPVGHSSTHFVHSLHLLKSIYAKLFSTVMASKRHTF